MTAESAPYSEFRNDDALLDTYIRHAHTLGRTFHTDADARMNRASTDMGNVSQTVPAIHPYIGIDSLPAVNHQAEFADASIRPAADNAILDGATALALTLQSAATSHELRSHLHPASISLSAGSSRSRPDRPPTH
jgi:metal-dependent amidase/aminoacylase/carboxypeptidase family protein